MQQIVKGKGSKPRRILLYGTHGIGKSTWAAGAPNPLFICTEDGLEDVGVDRTPMLTETIDVAKWLIDLGGEEHGYQTVVIDTLDWLERLIWAATCKDAGKKNIDEIGYNKGYSAACRRWEALLHMLEGCRAKGMNVILLAHAKVEKHSPPDTDPYDRWQLDLHKTAAPMIQEWCDEVFFATYRVTTRKEEEPWGQKRVRPVGSGERLVYTCEQPTHIAKRRIDLPDVLSLDWSEYQKHWPNRNGKPAGDIAGMVVEGSSKTKGKTDGKS